MKKVLLSLVATLIATMSLAQNGLVASLSHEGNVTYYYGVTALTQAVEAAASGDIINLSGGSFTATNITKGITIRGAGIDSQEPTYINGDFSINITDDTKRFMMEGIKCANAMILSGSYTNPFFLKCYFKQVTYNSTIDDIKNIMFVNCKIPSGFSAGANNTFNLVNCYIGGLNQRDNATLAVTNCIIRDNYYNNNYLRQCQFFNCIFISSNGRAYAKIPSSSQATDCISVNFGDHDFFSELSVRTGCPTTSLKFGAVFKTFTGTYTDEETFELTETAKTTYLGTDGLEIGLYGGLQPYNSTPSYPLITTMNVDKETTPEGKLGVTIEVSK